MNPIKSETAKVTVCSVITLALIAAAWHLAARYSGLSASVIPPPASVLDALRSGLIDGSLHEHIAFTLRCALIGFASGCSLGLLAGAAVAEFRPLELSFYPLVNGMQSVPQVAVAPVIVAYLGFDAESKIFTAALLCFFPVFVNSVTGFQAVDPKMLDLYKVFKASRWRRFIDIRLPAAANHVFAGLQVAAILSLIGCIVSEFVASTQGLGHVIKARAGELDISMMAASVLILATMGAVATAMVRLVHRLVVFWAPAVGQRRRPFWKSGLAAGTT